MSIAFPPAPVDGQTYTYNALEWVWTGDAWALNINGGQVSTGLVRVSNTVAYVNEFANSDLASSAWLHEVYV